MNIFKYHHIQDCLDFKEKYIDLFLNFYDNNDPVYSKGLCQEVDGRYLIQNPSSRHMEEDEMDKIASFHIKEMLIHIMQKMEKKVKCLLKPSSFLL